MSPGQLRFAVAVLRAADVTIFDFESPDSARDQRRLRRSDRPYAVVRDDASTACRCGPVLTVHAPTAHGYQSVAWPLLWEQIDLGHIAHGEFDSVLDYILQRLEGE